MEQNYQNIILDQPVNQKYKNMKYEINLTECGNESKKIKDLNENIVLEISMIGEGIVYKTETERGTLRMKIKGEKHSVSKVKVLAPVNTEKINSIKEFAEYAVTESRLEQGIEKVFTSVNQQIDIKKIGEFLKWIANDIVKEEIDTLKDNGLEPKEVNGAISNIARNWFLEKWNFLK